MAIKTEPGVQNLTEFEEQVLNIIKKILKKRIIFQLDSTFIDFCRRTLKVSEFDIYKAMYSLTQRKLVVPGSALTREQILENPSRQSIYETIQTHPGIHIRGLCKILSISSSVTYIQLQVLEKFDYIRKKTYTSPKFTLYFQKNFPDTYDDFFAACKNENAQRILQLLADQQLTLSTLSSQLNLHHSTIYYHLERLEHLDLIIRISKNQTITYTFNTSRLDTFEKFKGKFLSNL